MYIIYTLLYINWIFFMRITYDKDFRPVAY